LTKATFNPAQKSLGTAKFYLGQFSHFTIENVFLVLETMITIEILRYSSIQIRKTAKISNSKFTKKKKVSIASIKLFLHNKLKQ
jgi:hypothetical protein